MYDEGWFRETGADPREWEVPDWYKRKIEACGWRPCPEDEECSECGRRVIEGGEMCCGYHLSEKKLLARDDDGELCYPIPTKLDYIERLEEVERATAGAGEALEYMDRVMNFAVRDWAQNKRDRLLYGVVCGWGEAWEEMVTRYGWKPELVEQIRARHEAIKALKQLAGAEP